MMAVDQKQTEGLPMALVLLLFFSSGALALVYEVVWTRIMMNVFGSTAMAVGTVLAAFMSGMAVGSWLFGKLADRSGHCLRLYAWLEIGIGLAALLSHLLLNRINPAHIALYELFGSYPSVFGVVRFILAFVLVMAPTLLMGATLPVLTRFLVGRQAKVGVNLSTLYATNTFGAVSGVLVTGFFLIGTFGIHIPVYIAVAGNLLIGAVAWLISQQVPALTTVPTPPVTLSESPAGEEGGLGLGTFRFILLGLGVSGFTSFAYEIYWTRSLVFILGNSTFALSTMLGAFLTGIALGGYLIRFLFARVRDRSVIFGWIQVFLGVFSALALPLLFSIADPQSLNQYILRTYAHPVTLVFASFGVAFLVMLVPATLIGATFPLVGQIGVRDLNKTGASVGRIYAVNTIGNVLGALLPGFVLLSWLGIQKGILAMSVLNVGFGFVVLFLRSGRPPRHHARRFALATSLVLAAIVMSRAPLQFQFPSDGEQDYFETLFYREGPLATTKVYWNPQKKEKHMSVDGIVIGGTGYSEFKQLLLAHLPKLLLEDVTRELSVGLGSAILVGESARHVRVQEITGVEIEPGVIDGARLFAEESHHVLDNPRLRVVLDDIGNFLRTTSETYQVISADEKTADEYASNGFSYSIDYYDLLRRHLAPGGLVAQWVPTTLPPRQYQMVLKSFSESFPHVQLWYFLPAYKRGPFNSILIGSNQPVPVEPDHIGRALAEDPEAFASLVAYGLTSAEAVLPHFVADEKILRNALTTVPVNSLDHPRYEFFYPWDYARERERHSIANHEFLLGLKREAYPAYFASLKKGHLDTARLEKTFLAEDQYLVGFQKFLDGISLTEHYRLFDEALSVAPWNDSLRARIYAQYSYIASTRRDPSERARLIKRADSLYEEDSGE